MKVNIGNGSYWNVPDNKKTVCPISHYSDNTGYEHEGMVYPSDLDSDIHEGITIGNGNKMYWMMIWHESGHVTLFSADKASPQWIDGDTEVTIHFK